MNTDPTVTISAPGEGTSFTTVTDVTAAGFIWDGTTPANSFSK